jgi:hypothetical protein
LGQEAVSGENCLQIDTVGNITKTGSACGSGGGGTTTYPLTMNGSAAGATPGTGFDGSVARTISTNTIGIGTVYISPSGDTTGVTDNAAIQAAITAQKPVKLNSGSFYITGLSWSAPDDLTCDNLGGTFIYMVSSTNNMTTISYGGGQANNESIGMTIRGCNWFYKSGVTPTAGDVFNLSGTGSSAALSGVHIENNSMYNVWGGIRTGNYLVNNWVTNNLFINTVNGSGDGCIAMDTVSPGGDTTFDGNQCIGALGYADINIYSGGDTNLFENGKINNGSRVNFVGTSSNIVRERFTGYSIEGATGCAFNLNGAVSTLMIQATSVSVGTGTLFCNYTNGNEVQYEVNDQLSADGQPGWIFGGYPQFQGNGQQASLNITPGVEPYTKNNGDLIYNSSATELSAIVNGTRVNIQGAGTTGTITGTALTGTCDSGTVTITGVTVGHPVSVSSTTGADVGGAFNVRASVTATNTVTVYICGTGTPASLAYNVTVW